MATTGHTAEASTEPRARYERPTSTGLRALTGPVARVMFAVPFLMFGIMHFVMPEAMAGTVPEWLPGSFFWVYLTGAAHLAASTAIAANRLIKAAGVLLAVMLLGFAFLVHLPAVIGGEMAALSQVLKDFGLAAGALLAAHYGVHHAPGATDESHAEGTTEGGHARGATDGSRQTAQDRSERQRTREDEGRRQIEEGRTVMEEGRRKMEESRSGQAGARTMSEGTEGRREAEGRSKITEDRPGKRRETTEGRTVSEEAGRNQIEEGKREMDEGEHKLEEGKREMEEGKRKMEEGRRKIEEGTDDEPEKDV